MKDYKPIVITVLLTLVLSFTILLSSGFADVGAADYASVESSEESVDAPDGKYTYSVTTEGEHKISNKGLIKNNM